MYVVRNNSFITLFFILFISFMDHWVILNQKSWISTILAYCHLRFSMNSGFIPRQFGTKWLQNFDSKRISGIEFSVHCSYRKLSRSPIQFVPPALTLFVFFEYLVYSLMIAWTAISDICQHRVIFYTK